MSEHTNQEVQYKKFIKDICEQQSVFTLNDTAGFAVCTSHDYTFEDNTPLKVVCFWGTEQSAITCKKAEWKNKTPFRLDLPAFMENWCLGLDEDSHLVGVNFDEHLFGTEIRPLELLLDIIQFLKSENIPIDLIENRNLEALETLANDLLID